jgi:hypothetical protein
MSRYIDIEPILEWCDNPEVFEPYGVNSVELERKIRQAPSIEIIRCGECKWGKPYSDKQLKCNALGIGGLKFPEDFCSYGVRKITKEFTQAERSSE